MAELGVLVIGCRGRVDPLYALRPYHTAVANTGIETRMRRVILGAECIADDDARDTTQTNRLRDAVIRVSGASPLVDPFDQCDRAAQDLAHHLSTPALGLGARQARIAIVIKINIEICML
jgi:hypothetical protein